MVASKTTDRDQFMVYAGRTLPLATAADLAELCRLSRRHSALQAKACNGDVPEGHDAACEKKIRKLCERIGCGVRFGDDPRGCTVKLVLPNGATNDWGRQGWCVPQ